MIPAIITGANNDFGKPTDWDEEANGPCRNLWGRIERHGETIAVETAWEPRQPNLRT
jgi:hypothetical protein